METNVFDLSGKIDPATVDLLRMVDSIAKESGIRFFIVGAFAKEILLNIFHGIRTSRYTEDIDICIAVDSWADYDVFLESLILKGGYRSKREEQSIFFKGLERKLDIVPYGFKGTGKITWQNSGNSMDVSVYSLTEIRNVAVRIAQDPELYISCSSLDSFFIIKLLTWFSMYPDRQKDAIDLFEVMKNYYYTQEADRYFSEEIFDKMQLQDFDELFAGSFMLGSDISRQFPLELQQDVLSIVEKSIGESADHNLIKDAVLPNPFSDFEIEYRNSERAFEYLLQGLKS